jgi:hypothetical protein
VKKVIGSAREVYKLRGAEGKLHVVHPDCAHDSPDPVRRSVYESLDRQLK